MSPIEFNPGYSLANLPPVEVIRILPIKRLLGLLAGLRTAWTEAADGKELVDVRASVGLLLADICALLQLTPEETESVLGNNLAKAARSQ